MRVPVRCSRLLSRRLAANGKKALLLSISIKKVEIYFGILVKVFTFAPRRGRNGSSFRVIGG